MRLMLWELITLGAMLMCMIYEWSAIRRLKDIDADCGEIIWTMFAERTGAAKHGFWQKFIKKKSLSTSIPLSEGTFIVSNRLSGDIYVDSSGPAVKLYLNVQRGKLYVSILKGKISIDNCTCYANQTNRFELREYSSLRIADVTVQFCRKG